jgi:hypothetical protein
MANDNPFEHTANTLARAGKISPKAMLKLRGAAKIKKFKKSKPIKTAVGRKPKAGRGAQIPSFKPRGGVGKGMAGM